MGKKKKYYVTKNERIKNLQDYNSVLLKKIKILIERPNSIEAIEIKTIYFSQQKLEKALWAGEINGRNKFDGLISHITSGTELDKLNATGKLVKPIVAKDMVHTKSIINQTGNNE